MIKRSVCELELKENGKITKHEGYIGTWHIYSDKDECTETENLSFDDICEQVSCLVAPSSRFARWLYGVSNLKAGEKYCRYWIAFDSTMIIHEYNFVSFKVITTYKKNTNNNTLEYLMKNLAADEMIEYLKDNGLNVCPIAR